MRKDQDGINVLSALALQLKDICHSVHLVNWEYTYYSVIGQVYGEDTNIGDPRLQAVMDAAGIHYTWINAFGPTVSHTNVATHPSNQHP